MDVIESFSKSALALYSTFHCLPDSKLTEVKELGLALKPLLSRDLHELADPDNVETLKPILVGLATAMRQCGMIIEENKSALSLSTLLGPQMGKIRIYVSSVNFALDPR